jgi:YheC/D-like protein
MTHIGMLCNLDVDGDPREQLSPSVINRACLIDDLLAPDGIHVFLYCPKDISADGETSGYVLEQRIPVATRQMVPRVNANWSYRTRQLLRGGMGYQPFKRWMRDQGIEVYVPYEFSELVSNKLKTYELIQAWNPVLHPHTEEFVPSRAQLESFLMRANTVFVKPRAGHKGNRIFVVRGVGDGCSVRYYDSGEQRVFPSLSLDACVSLVDGAASRERYVMQEGIESLRCGDAVFDVRVVMVHDGLDWEAILESRVSPPGSDLSNVYQGGTVHQTGELLAEVVGRQEGEALVQRVRQVSYGIARHLESRFPGALSEIGLDFVLDTDHRPHLVEVNAKPGIAGIGSERRYLEWTLEEQELHEMWTLPHMNRLAGFLRSKIANS